MLIAITGKAGAGKDTAADVLVENYGFKKFGFAYNLKQMLASIGFEEPCRADKEKQIPGYAFSYRKAAQLLGTEWGRDLDADLWVKLLEKQIKRSGIRNIVISDLRFKNEARMVQKMGGRIVEIQRQGLVEVRKHASEAGLPEKDVDIVLQNDGTIAELKSKLCKALLLDDRP